MGESADKSREAISGAFEYNLSNLQKLYRDLEKQMLKFDEILPYERQETGKIYSPRLLNMMLACGPQIEAITKLIIDLCDLPRGNMPNSIKMINKKAGLGALVITSTVHKLGFTPFTSDLAWWTAYNKLKHDLNIKQFKLPYSTVMNTFAALAALHCLAEQIKIGNKEQIQETLNVKNWPNDSLPYKSLIFEISTVRKTDYRQVI